MVGPTDKVAQVAAAVFHAGDAASLAEAVEWARVELGGGSAPSLATVRRHLETLRQESIGLEQWRAERIERLAAIEELLQTLAYIEPDSVCYVVGRAAEGYVDATGPAHLRVVGSRVAALVADDLEQQGFPPCEVSSLATCMGSIGVIHLNDGPLRVALAILPEKQKSHQPRSVVDGRSVALVDEVGFRQLLEAMSVDPS